MISKITPYVIVIVVASMLGFITENIWVALRYGYLDNRGMMLPGLLGYGLAMVGMYFILGTPRQPRLLGYELEFSSVKGQVLYYILMAAVLVSIGEIVLGNLVEHFCEIEWWNYSTLPFHIGQYTSVFTSVGFGMMITIFMDNIFPIILGWALSLQSVGIVVAMFVALWALVMDFLHEAKYMITNKKINSIWTVDLKYGYIDKNGDVLYLHS